MDVSRPLPRPSSSHVISLAPLIVSLCSFVPFVVRQASRLIMCEAVGWLAFWAADAVPWTATKTPTTTSSVVDVDLQGGVSRRVAPGSSSGTTAKGKRGDGRKFKVGASVGSGGSGAKEAGLTRERRVGTTASTTTTARAATDRGRASSLSQAGGSRTQGAGRASTATVRQVAHAGSHSSTHSASRQSSSSGHGKHRRL